MEEKQKLDLLLNQKKRKMTDAKRKKIIKEHRKGIEYFGKDKKSKLISSGHDYDEIDQLEHDVATIKEDIGNVHIVYQKLENALDRIRDLEEKEPTVMDLIKKWIRQFLQVSKYDD